jgi:hypothetical protein
MIYSGSDSGSGSTTLYIGTFSTYHGIRKVMVRTIYHYMNTESIREKYSIGYIHRICVYHFRSYSMCIKNAFRLFLHRVQCISQSRQSARLFLPSSELGPPHPLAPRRVCPPPFGSGGGHTRLRERGGGVPIRTSGQPLWCSRYLCTLWCLSHAHRQIHFNLQSPHFQRTSAA